MKISPQELEAILHSLQDDILVTNRDGIIIKISEATGEIYGVKSEELIGKSVYDLEKEGLFTPILTPMVLKEKKRITFTQTTNKGKKLLVTGIPVFDSLNNIQYVVSYSHDITELREVKKYLGDMEEEMERVRSELEILRQKSIITDGIIANSEIMQKIMATLVQISTVDVNVFLSGEAGVGKSSLAKYIHQQSYRSSGPFIEVNCGAIPDLLFEAELFGYEPEAVTSINKKGKVGLAELAAGGTLFLKEVEELSLPNQVKLLHFIQKRKFCRLGGRKVRQVDVRIISSSNQDLNQAVKAKRFRAELFSQLNVVPIHIPPLRERPADIIALIDYYLNKYSAKYRRHKELDEGAMHHLLEYEWAGNIRQLVNTMERLVVTTPSSLITTANLPEEYRYHVSTSEKTRPLSEVIESVEKQVLSKAKRKFKTTIRMAEALGVSQPSIVRKLKKYGLNE